MVDEETEVKTDSGVSLRAKLIPGADALVHALKRRGYLLALVADGPVATFRNNLSPFGLYDLFDAYAISEAVGVKKPHPRIFRKALSVLDIPKDEYHRVVMVGNNLARDVKGANELGLISVWLNWSPRRRKEPVDPSEVPQYTIEAPLELLAVLDAIERR